MAGISFNPKTAVGMLRLRDKTRRYAQHERSGHRFGQEPFALITSDLAGVFWQPSRMASSSISSPHSGRYRREDIAQLRFRFNKIAQPHSLKPMPTENYSRRAGQ